MKIYSFFSFLFTDKHSYFRCTAHQAYLFCLVLYCFVLQAKDALSKALTFTYKFGGADFARYDTQKENLPSSTDPAAIQCQNDVVSASLRRNDVATTSTPRHFDDVFPVGDCKNTKEEGNPKPSGIEMKGNITEIQAAVQEKDSIPKNGSSRGGEGLKELNYQNKQLAEKEKGSWTRKSC